MKKLLCFAALAVLGLLVSCSTTFDGYDLTSNADIETVGAAITEATLEAQFDLFPDYPRHIWASDSKHEQVEAAIVTQLASYGYSVVTQNVDLLVNNTTYNMNNIIAIKEGTANSNTPIIVSGHWDTVDDSPGMNDNASGCVATLDIARSLQDQSTSHDVYFVFYAFEEEGYYENGTITFAGSETFYQSIDTQGITPKLVINMDMIAYTADEEPSPNDLSQIIDWPTVGDHIFVFGLNNHLETVANAAEIARSWVPDLNFYNLNVSLEQVKSNDIFSDMKRSDHFTFWKYDINTIFLTVSDMRFEHYHLPTDTKDKIDYTFLRKVTQWMFYTAYFEAI